MATRLAIGPASQSLGKSLAERLRLEAASVLFKEFPDGETYVKLTEVSPGDDLIVVQSLSPPQARNLMVLLQIASAARDIGVRRISVVAPYLAYSRQDKMFLPGEAVSARLVAKVLESCGVQRVYVVEPHSAESLSFFRIPAVPVSPVDDIVKFLGDRTGSVIVAPDEKRVPDARELASKLSCDYGWVEKTRDRDTGEVRSKIGSVPHGKKTAVIFDDIISSGSTIVKAAELLRSIGFEEIEAGCVHGLFVQRAEEKLAAAGVRSIFASDTIEGKMTRYSVAGSIAKSIEKDGP